MNKLKIKTLIRETIEEELSEDWSTEKNAWSSPEAKQIVAVIDGATSFVVMDEDNRHYREILEQVKEGKLTIKDAD